MAGPGAAPKEPEERRRTNDKSKGLETLPAAGYTGDYPPLPLSYERTIEDNAIDEPLTIVTVFRDETLEWYEAWATSPMAVKFTRVEWMRLRSVLAPLFDAFVRQPSTKLASELRLQESLLGATHTDRLRANMRVGEPEQPVGAQSRGAKRSSRVRSAHLQAV